MKEHCDENGKQHIQNLSQAAQHGRIKLAKLMKNKEHIVIPSDKGKGIVVISMDMYKTMGFDHMARDKEIGWDEMRLTQREMNANSRALVRIFGVGEAQGEKNYQRCFNNATSTAYHNPNLRASPKTHQPQQQPVTPSPDPW